MTDLNALAERLERDTRDAVGDLRHAIAIASQAQPDWRSTWEAALAELMPSELDRQAAQALRGMGEAQLRFMSANLRDIEGTEDFLIHYHERVLVADNIDAALAARAQPPGGEVVMWACKTCNSPRPGTDTCWKCGGALRQPADGWDWPGLPDIDRIRALAKEVGYAVGVHGSMERDLDLIAAPWVADAVTPPELAQHIAEGLGGRVVDDKVQDKPCGRWSCNIHTPDWTKMIDLSVMPAHPAEPAARCLGSSAAPLPTEQTDGPVVVPRDEQGRTAYDIIRESNHASMLIRSGAKDRSREPLLGPPSDMAVSRVILAERPDETPKTADLLAVKINDTLAALAATAAETGAVQAASCQTCGGALPLSNSRFCSKQCQKEWGR